MRRKQFIWHCALVCTLLGYWGQAASGTSIDHDAIPVFEEAVVLADFVGTVECVIAGGLIAKYKVLECWKGGHKPGDIISVKQSANYWGGQFPVTLCGYRVLLTAFKSSYSSAIMTTSSYDSGPPLWWRKIPVDYRIPLSYGTYGTPEGRYRGFEPQPSSRPGALERSRKTLTSLVEGPPDVRELLMIQGLMMRSYVGPRISPWPDEEFARRYRDRREKVMGLNTTGEALELLWEQYKGDLVRLRELRAKLPQNGDQKARSALEGRDAYSRRPSEEAKKIWALERKLRDLHRILTRGGGPVVLKVLDAEDVNSCPLSEEDRKKIASGIRKRLAPRKAKARARRAEEPEREDKAPSPEELEKLRESIAEGEEHEGFGEAFHRLGRYDPSSVVQYLLKWKETEVPPRQRFSPYSAQFRERLKLRQRAMRSRNAGYEFISYFAVRCGKDRKAHFTTLLKARDGYIRVGAGVYLCFEDEKAGIAALKRLAQLGGEPGAGAALPLVRRGRKAFMPRALTVFPPYRRESVSGMETVPHRNLQERLKVLLSNTAKASGLPQPYRSLSYVRPPKTETAPARTWEEQRYDDYVKWWKEHEEKAIMHDPWMPILAKQKID